MLSNLALFRHAAPVTSTLDLPMSNDPRHNDWLETYKSLTTLSTEDFKFCALANGGAAVAILAYLGNVVGQEFAYPCMTCPIAIFLAWLILCGVTMLFAYFKQLSRLNRLFRREDPSKDWLLWVAIVLFISSLSAFAFGSWKVVVAFQHSPLTLRLIGIGQRLRRRVPPAALLLQRPLTSSGSNYHGWRR